MRNAARAAPDRHETKGATHALRRLFPHAAAARYVLAENVGMTGVRTDEVHQHAYRGGLACAVGAEEAKHLPFIDRDIQFLDA